VLTRKASRELAVAGQTNARVRTAVENLAAGTEPGVRVEEGMVVLVRMGVVPLISVRSVVAAAAARCREAR